MKKEKRNYRKLYEDEKARADAVVALAEALRRKWQEAVNESKEFSSRLKQARSIQVLTDAAISQLNEENKNLKGQVASGTRIIDRQRDLLILYEQAARVANRMLHYFSVVEHKSTQKHDFFGARCVLQDENWKHLSAYSAALDCALAGIVIDIATGKEAR